MNKGFMYTSDKEIVVTDENGKINTREITGIDTKNILILENNLENINERINIVEEKLKTAKKVKDNSSVLKKMVRKGFIITEIIASLIPFINKVNILINIICNFIFVLISYGMFLWITLKLEKDNIKKINGLENQLKKLNQLKEEYESRLEKTKTMIEKEKIQIGKVVSLEEYMNLPKEITEEINFAFELGYNEPIRKLRMH